MSDPIHPVGRLPATRRVVRRRVLGVDRTQETHDGAATSDPPPSIHDAEPAPSHRDATPSGFAAFAAHLLGQKGPARELGTGKPVLQAARSTYLHAEWSGPNDRRRRKGVVKKTEI